MYEEFMKISDKNRLQTLLNTDFTVVQWEKVYEEHIPVKAKVSWRAVLKKMKKEKKQRSKKEKRKKKKVLDNFDPL